MAVLLQALTRDAEGRMGSISNGWPEKSGYKSDLGEPVVTADVVNLAFPDHRHHLVARQCSSGRSQTAEAQPWSHQPFDASVV